MKQDFDLHLTKSRDKSRLSWIRKKGMKRYLAVLLSIVLATGTCLPAMAAEQPQAVETESAAVAPSAEAAAEANEEVPAVSEENVNEESSEGITEETAPKEEPSDNTETAAEGTSEPSEAATEEPAAAATEGAAAAATEGTEVAAEIESTEKSAAGASVDAAKNGNTGDSLVVSVPGEELEAADTAQNASSQSGEPIGPDDSSWLQDFVVNIDGDTVVLYDAYMGSESNVTIPGEATLHGVIYHKVRITNSIRWNACTNLSFEQGVEFPDDSSWLFGQGWNLSSIDLSNVDTSNVTNMSNMFYGLNELEEVNLSGVDTSSVTNMREMFDGCYGLKNLDVSGFDMSNVSDISCMFDSCYFLKELDLSSWNLSSVVNGDSFLRQYQKTIKTPLNLQTDIQLDGNYKDPEGNTYEYLPKNLDTSITLTLVNDTPNWLDDYVYYLNDDIGYDLCNLQLYIGDASVVSVPGTVEINGKEYTVSTENPFMWNKGVTSLSFEEGFKLCQYEPYFGFTGSDDLEYLDLQYVDMSQCYGLNMDHLPALETIKTPVGFYNSITLPAAFEDAEGNIYTSIPAYMEESLTLTRAEVSDWLKDYQYSIREEKIILDRYIGDGGTVTIKSSATIGTNYYDTVQLSENVFVSRESNAITGIIFEQGVEIPRDFSNPFWRLNQLTSIDFSGADFSNAEYVDNLLSNCRNLTTIQTPVNLTLEVYLAGAYVDGQGNVFTSLPMNRSDSITLTKTEQQSPWLNDFAYHIEGDKIVLTGGYSGSEPIYTVPGSAQIAGQDFNKVEITRSLDWGSVRNLSFAQGVVFPDSCEELFEGYGPESIDLTNVDTSNVRDMYSMFSDNWNLRSVNFGSIDTSNVTDMSYMFSYCSNIVTLDLSSFNTTNVTNMNNMFAFCGSINALDVSSFNTTNVTDMCYMFAGCYSLASLDLSGFDMSNVTDMYYMFYQSNIGELDIRGWDLSSLDLEKSTPFCGDIVTIHAPAGLSTEAANCCILNRQYTGSDGNGYWHLPENSDTSITLTMIEGSTSGDPSISDDPDENSPWLNDYYYEIDGDAIVLLGGSSPEQTDYTVPGSAVVNGESYYRVQLNYGISWNCENLSFEEGVEFPMSCGNLFADQTSLRSIDFTNIDTSNVIDMMEMFSGCTNLTELDLSGLNTSYVNNMNRMFKNCSSLTELDLSGLDTSNVSTMLEMFAGCTSLTELDVSGFTAANIYDIDHIFYDCINLSRVDLSSWDLSQLPGKILLTNGAIGTIEAPLNVEVDVFLGARYLGSDGNTYMYLPKSLSNSITLTKTNPVITEGTSPWLNDYDYVVEGDKIVLTGGYVGDQKDVTVPGNAEVNGVSYDRVQITSDIFWNCESLSFDQGVEFPNNCYGLFEDEDELKSISLSNIDTSNVTEMAYMFDDCDNLSSLNISGIDTSNVTVMSGMFRFCSSLESLDLSGFDTSNVTDMGYMFSFCHSLTELDLSGFNTSKVTFMSGLFQDCMSLENLELSGFDTSNVTHMGSMFWECRSLEELDLTGFDTSNVVDMSSMFGFCTSLTALDVRGFDTSKVEDVWWMFDGCDNLYQLDLSSWDLSSAKYDSSIAEGELEIIKAPLGVKVEIRLGDSYYGSDGNVYEYLPKNLTKSITLAKNEEDLPVEPVELKIITQPTDVYVTLGETAEFTVDAEGEGLTYQWYYKNANAYTYLKSSQTTETYVVALTEKTKKRKVYCEITDKYGTVVETDRVGLYEYVPFEITEQPEDAYVNALGEKATISVSATGYGLTYQWYYKNEGASKFLQSTNTSDTYTITVNEKVRNRQVYCEITDENGEILRSETAGIYLNEPFEITEQPEDVFVDELGETATISVSATGTSLTYQWYYKNASKNSFLPSTNTTPTYSVTVNERSLNRQVYCEITDVNGETIRSETVGIYLNEPFEITEQPQDVTVEELGDRADVSVTATGTGLTYQWYYKNEGATKFLKSTNTTPVYSVTVTERVKNRQVYCEITDAHGSKLETDRVSIYVSEPFEITEQPQNVTVGALGDRAEVSVAATGKGLTYQWYYKNATASTFLPSTNTTPTYSVIVNERVRNRQVYCKITDANGEELTTDTVKITVSEQTEESDVMK